MRKAVGIDFGMTELRVSVPEQGIVMRSPSVVAVNRETNQRSKFGVFARKAAEEHPILKVVRAFRASVLEDTELAERIFRWCLNETFPSSTDANVIYSVPCSLGDAEECALVELLLRSGFAEAHLLYSPVAALIGSGCSLRGTYVSVNIGARSTNIVVLSDGQIIDRSSVAIGGDAFCSAIGAYVEKKHRIKINFAMAERIKRSVGTVWLEEESLATDIVGTDAENTCRQAKISSEEMFTALEEPCAGILDAICSAASKIPLEKVSDALQGGIVLTGGGAYLKGISHMIEGITGFPCKIPNDASDAVAKGLALVGERLPNSVKLHNASLVAVKCFY